MQRAILIFILLVSVVRSMRRNDDFVPLAVDGSDPCEKRQLAGDFVSLQDEEGAVKEPEFNIHRRDETRMRYETHLKDRYLENMRSMNSSGIDTKMCQGQSTTVDNFMHLSLQVMAIGNPNEDSPHVAPECLERESSGDPEFIRERFLCETGFLASV